MGPRGFLGAWALVVERVWRLTFTDHSDRKSTRLNSSHLVISYAVFCLKNKIKNICSSTRKEQERAMRSNVLPDLDVVADVCWMQRLNSLTAVHFRARALS